MHILPFLTFVDTFFQWFIKTVVPAEHTHTKFSHETDISADQRARLYTPSLCPHGLPPFWKCADREKLDFPTPTLIESFLDLKVWQLAVIGSCMMRDPCDLCAIKNNCDSITFASMLSNDYGGSRHGGKNSTFRLAQLTVYYYCLGGFWLIWMLKLTVG